ncbi:hypothetical protein OV079_34200 [Nannocystis pusilla]|uniref:Uncharacterized protein n=1 Tax=Nannocystis pusilla TaxID=889268 RepID=A0A9X3EUY2_9BACT|nr:hypothetical protein [Nannocystis pusilla]MCY1010531.1 hypothetical protein [Nannocystis pusilla]
MSERTSGTPAASSPGGRGARAMWPWTSSTGSWPVNGGPPVSIS